MGNKKLLIGSIFEEEAEIGFTEVTHRYRVSQQEVIAMVDEGILELSSSAQESWLFDTVALRRLQITQRLQRDLQINLAGAALILDLLDELELLRKQST